MHFVRQVDVLGISLFLPWPKIGNYDMAIRNRGFEDSRRIKADNDITPLDSIVGGQGC